MFTPKDTPQRGSSHLKELRILKEIVLIKITDRDFLGSILQSLTGIGTQLRSNRKSSGTGYSKRNKALLVSESM